MKRVLKAWRPHLKAVSDSLEAANIKLVSLRFEREDLTAQIEDLDDANTVNIKQRQDQLKLRKQD